YSRGQPNYRVRATVFVPSLSNEIRWASNNLSSVATNGIPLLESRRSTLLQSRHGLMCDAHNANVDPVTAHLSSHSARTLERKVPWPIRARTNCSFPALLTTCMPLRGSALQHLITDRSDNLLLAPDRLQILRQ